MDDADVMTAEWESDNLIKKRRAEALLLVAIGAVHDDLSGVHSESHTDLA